MRINIIGGPGSGKDTTATRLFADLKILNYNIEYVDEFVKPWAYSGVPIQDFDQVYITASQLYKEQFLLHQGVKNLITSSPIILGSIYARYYKHPCYKELDNISFEFDQKYPAICIYLQRNYLFFKSEGRYQDLEEAKQIDALIEQQIYTYNSYKFPVENYKDIKNTVISALT